MSLIFGILNPEGECVGQEELVRLARATQHLAPDGTFLHVEANLGLGYQPFHTSHRSWLDHQPRIDRHRNALLLDGRLDNHEELQCRLKVPDRDVPDSDLVLFSFALWGEDCFAQLRGDWALVLWNHEGRKLYLARDHAGTRQLYFIRRSHGIVWSSTLHALIADGSSSKISHAFAARFLTGQPTSDVTPFEAIQSVRPAHCVVLSTDSSRSLLHWCPGSQSQVYYRTSDQYDQRFLELFRTSVARRIDPEAGILAQLSGGMDSSAIVCVADQVRESLSAPLVDTISFFDDSEPHWNERPYFTEVERKRGREGIHIDLSETHRLLELRGGTPEALLSPTLDCGRVHLESAIREQLGPSTHRVVLSGFAGDELLGGVPTPLPELVDLLASGRLSALLSRGTEWSIRTRTPLIHLLWRTIHTVAQLYRRPSCPCTPPPWIRSSLTRLPHSSRSVRTVTPRSVRRAGPGNILRWEAWWSLVDALPQATPSSRLYLEYRYPYLDRDLVEFLLGVPRHELCAPGRRRAMMRRALRDIVPDMILERPRKAYVSRRPLALLRGSIIQIEELFAASCMAECGFLDPRVFHICLGTALKGETQWVRPLLATIAYEVWLRTLDGIGDRSPLRTAGAVSPPPGSVPTRTAGGRHG
jgi:asparagine synthase (glutamine-hydrolysing)